VEDFMKKIKQGIDKGIKTVATKSKEIVDSTLVKKEIGDLEDEKRNTFEALGQIVYKMSQENRRQGRRTEKDHPASPTSPRQDHLRLLRDRGGRPNQVLRELRRQNRTVDQTIGRKPDLIHIRPGFFIGLGSIDFVRFSKQADRKKYFFVEIKEIK
jgi:hypothetical protein